MSPAAASRLGRFSRWAQSTVGSPDTTASAMRAIDSLLAVRDGSRDGSARTCSPISSAYGRTVSRQRAAVELTTRAAGAKEASRLASALASARPLSSSGRTKSSSFQPDLGSALACRSRISGTVCAESLAKSSSTPWSWA